MTNKQRVLDSKEQFNRLKAEAEKFCEYKKELSYKIPYLLLNIYFNWDEETITECLRDLGSKDSGIDGYYVDEYNKCFYLFQFKTRKNYTEGENKDAKDDWFSVLANFIPRKVKDLNYDPQNDRIKEIIPEIRTLLENKYEPKLFLIHMGFASENLIENYPDIEYINLNNILEKYQLWLEQDIDDAPDNCSFDIHHPTKEDQPGFIMFDLKAPNGHKKKSIVCTLDGNQIVKILEQGSTILDRNVRGFLGETNDVNKGIINTASNTPQQFYFFNNGIKITCEKIEHTSPNKATIHVDLKNPQIINGAQTVNSIKITRDKLRLKNKSKDFIIEHLKKINVLCMIIESTKSEDADLARKMTTYSNKQNKIKLSDFYSNQTEHISLVTQFEKYNIIYVPKRNEKKFSEQELSIGMETLAEFHMAQTINPFEAKATKIFIENCENDSESNYSKIFSIKNKNLDKQHFYSLLKTFFIYKCSSNILKNIKKSIDCYDSNENFNGDDQTTKILKQYFAIKPSLLNDRDEFFKHEKYKYFKIIEIKILNYLIREIIDNLSFSSKEEEEIKEKNINDTLISAFDKQDYTMINQIVENTFKDSLSLYIDIIKKLNCNDIKKISRKKSDWEKLKNYVDDYVCNEGNNIQFKLLIF